MKRVEYVFIGSVVTMCMATILAAPDLSIVPPGGSRVVSKTIVSSRMRFVFTVGLEGTGHHYIGQVEDHLFQTNEDLVRISRRDNVNRDLYTMEHTMGGNAQHYGTNLNAARENMRKLARRGADLQGPGTVVFMPGKNSYPNGPGPRKALKYMDLRMLAEVAEEEGVDLRVLYLRRPVEGTLLANTIHRQFQNGLHNKGTSRPDETYMEYMQILLTDIAVMHSFLAELDSGFVVCHDFDRFGSVDQSAAISDFLAPNNDVAARLSTSFIDVGGAPRAPSNESLLYEGADVVAGRLQRKFDTFESQICHGMKDE